VKLVTLKFPDEPTELQKLKRELVRSIDHVVDTCPNMPAVAILGVLRVVEEEFLRRLLDE
jgi:hypothetical protein